MCSIVFIRTNLESLHTLIVSGSWCRSGPTRHYIYQSCVWRSAVCSAHCEEAKCNCVRICCLLQAPAGLCLLSIENETSTEMKTLITMCHKYLGQSLKYFELNFVTPIFLFFFLPWPSTLFKDLQRIKLTTLFS